jgi:hypothetical protein
MTVELRYDWTAEAAILTSAFKVQTEIPTSGKTGQKWGTHLFFCSS